MADFKEKKDPEFADSHNGHSSKETDPVPTYHDHDVVDTGVRESRMTRLGLTPSSFKRRTAGTNTDQLHQSMKPRHLHMIAIGGSIGAGFFVGSGSALNNGGPASLLIGFIIMGVMIFNVVYALGELAIMYPVSGGFYTYSVRFIDPSWGFAMGWNYVIQWAIVLPLELTVASFTVGYWNKEINISAWITLFWVVILIISVFGILGYAEEEFWASALKLTTVVIFIFVAVILVCGGGPSGGKYEDYWGARYFYDPGGFKNGFPGFCSVFVTAAFSFSGTELVGLGAAEAQNPAKALPGAIKQVFWRITLFYVVGLLMVGLLVSSTDDRLLGANPYSDGSSPFVLAVKDAGLKGFDSFINFVILISVISIGLSGVFGGSRTLTALAEQGYAPRFFSYIDRAGRPLWSTIFILAFSPLAYISVTASGSVVFDWLLALSGLAALFTWGSICLSHIRFRTAWKYHGHTIDELPFKAPFGVAGSWVSLGLIVLVLIATFYSALVPPGTDGTEIPPRKRAESFFKGYLALPVVLFFWGCGYVWKGKGWLKVEQMDVDTGRRELDWEAITKHREHMASLPAWRRALHLMF